MLLVKNVGCYCSTMLNVMGPTILDAFARVLNLDRITTTKLRLKVVEIVLRNLHNSVSSASIPHGKRTEALQRQTYIDHSSCQSIQYNSHIHNHHVCRYNFLRADTAKMRIRQYLIKKVSSVSDSIQDANKTSAGLFTSAQLQAWLPMMVSTVNNGNDRLRNGNRRSRPAEGPTDGTILISLTCGTFRPRRPFRTDTRVAAESVDTLLPCPANGLPGLTLVNVWDKRKDVYIPLTNLVFLVRTVSYGPSIFPFAYGPSAKRAGYKSTGKNEDP